MWIQLTRKISYDALNPDERKALLQKEQAWKNAFLLSLEEWRKAGSLPEDEPEPPPSPDEVLDDLVASLTAEIRACVISGARNELPPDATLIPDSLKLAATAKIRFSLLTRFQLNVSEARTLEWKQADALLADVRRGTMAVEQPDGSPTKSNPSPTYRSRPRWWGPERRRGVM